MNFLKVMRLSISGQLDGLPVSYADWRLLEPEWNKKLSDLQGFNTPYYQKWLDARQKLLAHPLLTPPQQ